MWWGEFEGIHLAGSQGNLRYKNMKMLGFSNRSGVSRCIKNFFFFLWEFLLKLWTLHTLGMKLHLIFVCLIMKRNSTYLVSLYRHILQSIDSDKKNVWLLRLSIWLRFHFKESIFLCVLFQLIEVRNKDIHQVHLKWD